MKPDRLQIYCTDGHEGLYTGTNIIRTEFVSIILRWAVMNLSGYRLYGHSIMHVMGSPEPKQQLQARIDTPS